MTDETPLSKGQIRRIARAVHNDKLYKRLHPFLERPHADRLRQRLIDDFVADELKRRGQRATGREKPAGQLSYGERLLRREL